MASALLLALVCLVCLVAGAAPAAGAGLAERQARFHLRDLKLLGPAGGARVALAGTFNRGRAGEPELPVATLAVELPPGARVTGWQVIPLEVVDLPARARLALLDGWRTGSGELVRGPAGIRPQPRGDTWFPERPYGELKTGFLQGHAIASVAVRPVQCLAAEERVRLITGFRLRVSYEEADGPRPLRRVRTTGATEAAARRALGALGLPFEPAAGSDPARVRPFAAGEYPGPLGREAAYLIVTPDSLAATFQPLADWKTRQGISAGIVTFSQVQARYPQGVDLPEKIRLCVRDAYLYNGTQWLLLGGTGQLIPPRYAFSLLQHDAPVPTDMYYSNLDGNWNANANSLFAEAFADSFAPGDGVDLYPEVYVGRAPILNTAEAAVFVAKTLAYDQDPPRDYLERTLLFAEVVFPVDWVAGEPILYDGALLAQDVADRLPPWTRVARLYENNDQEQYPGSLPETRQAVFDSLGVGYNIAVDCGHGYRNTMSVGAGSLINADMRALTNGPRNSFLVALDCTAAAFDFDCIAAASVTAPHGGAFAFWGSTREDFPQVSKAYVDNFFNTVNRDSVGELGEALALCKVPFIPVSDTDDPDRWTQFAFVLLGDPGLRLRLRAPSEMTVTAPSTFVLGDPGYAVLVTSGGAPVESALVCVRKPGDDLRAGYTDASGQVTLAFQPDSTGGFELTATRRNFLPHMGSGTVAPRGPAYLYDASPVKTILDGTLVPQNGNGDGAVDAGETVQVRVPVANGGDLAAAGATGILLSTTAGVSVLSSMVNYGAIPAHATAPGNGAYLVRFSRSLRDGLKVPFTLRLTDITDDIRSDYFTATVRAPAVEHYAHSWTDSVAGADHFTLLRVTLRNLGGGPFHGLVAKVLPESSALSPMDSVSAYGSLAVGASSAGTGQFRYAGQATGASRFRLLLSDAYGWADTLGFSLEPPGPVSGLAAQGSNTSITLTWYPPADPAPIAGYYIYRSTDPAGPFTRSNPRITGRTTYFNDAGLAPLTTYYYQVTAVDSGANESVPSAMASVSTNPPYRPGWPVMTGKEMAGSPVLVNLDHSPDGSQEILVGTDGVRAWRADGGEQPPRGWVGPPDGPWVPRGIYASSIAVADLFQDGQYAVVGMSQDSGLVFVWDEYGRVAPGWPRRVLSGFPFGSPAIGDIDGDGHPDIALGCGGQVYAWHADGSELADGDHNPSTQGVIRQIGGSYLYGSPALADLDGDGRLDIILGGSDARMHAIRHDGTECRGWPLVAGAPVTGSAAVADLDLDGHYEVVFPSNSNFLYCVSDSGTEKPGWAVPMALDRTSRSPSPALADLDGDGYLDVIEATTDGHLRALDHLGHDLPGWGNVRYATAYASYAGTSESSPVVADLDGDGSLEILEGAEDAMLYGFRADGTVLGGFPLRVGGEIRSSPAVWDLGNTGQASIVLSCWDKFVYVWDYPGGFSPARAPWPMFRHDDMHTGLYADPGGVTAAAGGPALPSHAALFQNRPNPCRGATTIRFQLPVRARGAAGTGAVRLTVHDASGRLVRTLADGALAPGTYTRTWDGTESGGARAASGIYFCRLAAGGEVLTRKMLLVK
ncbi:MAG: VCBS repeat-containing protein [Candidatus Eisenbacteria bacterium]|nr:VCBS repeat-containing protein [Candidatus Eisenbacteria bacterium]